LGWRFKSRTAANVQVWQFANPLARLKWDPG
jgi:hypothetical protein